MISYPIEDKRLEVEYLTELLVDIVPALRSISSTNEEWPLLPFEREALLEAERYLDWKLLAIEDGE
jgi:hypothetical protein